MCDTSPPREQVGEQRPQWGRVNVLAWDAGPTGGGCGWMSRDFMRWPPSLESKVVGGDESGGVQSKGSQGCEMTPSKSLTLSLR